MGLERSVWSRGCEASARAPACVHHCRPATKWAQRLENVMVTIDVQDVTKPEVSFAEQKLSFKGKAKDAEYALDLELFEQIDPAACKWAQKGRTVELLLAKKDKSKWW